MGKRDDYVSRGRSFEDDSSSALKLSHRADGTPLDRKGRAIVRLPEPQAGYRPELVGKSPTELAQIFDHEAAERDADENVDYARLMEEVPAGRAAGHSSSSGRAHPRPPPPPDYTNRPIVDVEAPAKYRPHQVGGRVSTAALHGLSAQKPSIGEMLDTLGEALNAGVSWLAIEFTISAGHSSSSGRAHPRPPPPPDYTNRPIVDVEAPAKYRPHQVGGRVSTAALHGLSAQKPSIGEMLDTLGEALNAGVSWLAIEFTISGLRARAGSKPAAPVTPLSYGKLRS